jgi:hypothetical protein
MGKPKEPSDDKRLTLAPLSFEEALTGLLHVAPPPKDDAPETAPESPPAKQPRKRKPRQDDTKRPPTHAAHGWHGTGGVMSDRQQASRREVYSAIEGVLGPAVVDGEQGYTASINDRHTAITVRFCFAHERLGAIEGLFGKNVIAGGVVLFSGDLPLRFLGTPDIKERARNRSLRSFVGRLPALPDGEMAEDFLVRLHDASATDATGG